jgi:hypothetical protein
MTCGDDNITLNSVNHYKPKSNNHLRYFASRDIANISLSRTLYSDLEIFSSRPRFGSHLNLSMTSAEVIPTCTGENAGSILQAPHPCSVCRSQKRKCDRLLPQCTRCSKYALFNLSSVSLFLFLGRAADK